MTYIKICQIADFATHYPELTGEGYLETVAGVLQVSKSLVFPLQLKVEVIDFGNKENFDARGAVVKFEEEIVIVPDNSISIRRAVFNQLVGKYPSLVM